MKMKTFQAKTFREALIQVKKELGEDAVILSSEEKKGRLNSVVVEAAVDYEIGDIPVPKQMAAAAAGPALAKTTDRESLKEGHQGAEVVQLRRALTEMCADVGTIRGYLETVKADAEEASLTSGKRDVLHFLRERGVREEYARELCGRVSGLTGIPGAMLDKVAVRKGGWNTCKAVMLVGPTGVGKTTTIAKLAAAAARSGLRAAIVSLDNYRIGALEQIRIYSKIMGVPLEIAADAQRVKACVERHTDKDVIFIDTTGRNPLSTAFLSELLPVYEAGVSVETHLLFSAVCDYSFLELAWKAYSRLPVDYIGITKVDEAVLYGALYNVAALCGKPITYLTTGQTVPGDIMFPSRKKMLQMVLTESFTGMEAAAAAQG